MQLNISVIKLSDENSRVNNWNLFKWIQYNFNTEKKNMKVYIYKYFVFLSSSVISHHFVFLNSSVGILYHTVSNSVCLAEFNLLLNPSSMLNIFAIRFSKKEEALGHYFKNFAIKLSSIKLPPWTPCKHLNTDTCNDTKSYHINL